MAGSLELDGAGDPRRSSADRASAARVGIVLPGPRRPSSSWSGSRTTSRSGSRTAAGRWRRCARACRRRSRRWASAGFERRRSRRLSGGQQQRLALAGVARAAARACSSSTSRRRTSTRPARPRSWRALARCAPARSTTIVLDRAPRRGRLAAGRSRPGARRRRAADRCRPAGRRRWPVGGAMRDAGIWLPAAIERRIAGDPVADGVAAAGQVAAEAPSPTAVDRGDDLRFGYDRGEPVVRDVAPRIDAGRAGRARRAERQRQVDARRGCWSACCGPTPGTVRLARRRSGPAAAAPSCPARRVRLPGSGAPVPGPDRRRGDPARACGRGAARGAGS